MKRIKYEEIQNSIQNYIKQRNLSTSLLSSATTNNNNNNNNYLNNEKNKNRSSFKKQLINSNPSSSMTDLNLIALNDLALIESSINDYYTFSLSSPSEQEYLKQYDAIRKFVQLNRDAFSDLEQLIFPFFVYMIIDLISMGHSIKNIINKFISESKNSEFEGEQRCLVENLILFSETKDLTKCKLVNNWIENKCQINLSSKSWKRFLHFLRKSSVHLFMHIINLNVQIIVSDCEVENEADESEPLFAKSFNMSDFVKTEPNEMENFVEFKPAEFALGKNDEEHCFIKKEFMYNAKNSFDEKLINSSDSISLKSLNECIEKIKSETSSVNAACCYYFNDSYDCVTSANISPNTEQIAFTNENSSIYLFKLNDHQPIKIADDHHQQQQQQQQQHKNYLGSSRLDVNQNYVELIGGHSGTVFKAKFTHDSKYLLSCGSDNIACLWNVNTKSSIQEFDTDDDDNETNFSTLYPSCSSSLVCAYSGHLYPVWDVELFSQLNLFATSSKDGTARLWSFDRLYPLRVYCGHQSDVNCVQFHPNGSYLATGSSDKTVRLWSVQTGEFVRLFSGHRSRVFSMAFSPDGNYLASAGEDKKIKLWDLRTSSMLKEFKGHCDIVHSLAFDNNSEILFSGGLDKTVKMWDVHARNVKLGGVDLSEGGKGGTPNSSHSSELIRSSSVEFNVYSIYCDVQNVFYVNGARKPASEAVGVSAANGVIEEGVKKEARVTKVEKPVKPATENASSLTGHKMKKNMVQPAAAQSSPSTKSTINTRRRTAQTSGNNSQQTPTQQQTANNSAISSSFFFNTDDDLYEI